MRTGLIGCGIIALLCLLIGVGGVLYVKKNPGALLDFAVGSIEKNSGPDVTEEDKKELRAVVAEVKEAIRSGRMRSDRNMGWQRSFSRSGSRKLTHEDVQEIIRAFRESIGPLPGGAAPPPTLAPISVPTPSP
jgi:hypothetical protein